MLEMSWVGGADVDGRYGVGVQHQTHWIVPFIGYGIVAGGLSGIPAITLTYRTPLSQAPSSSPPLLLRSPSSESLL